MQQVEVDRVSAYLNRVSGFSSGIKEILSRTSISVIHPNIFWPSSSLKDLRVAKVSTGSGTLPSSLYFVDDSNEGHRFHRYFNRVNELADLFRCNPQRIIVLNQNEGFRAASNANENSRSVNSSVVNRQFPEAIAIASSLTNSQAEISIRRRDYTHRFLSLNNLARPHRIALASLIKDAGLLEQTAMSFHFAQKDALRGAKYFLDKAFDLFPQYAAEITRFMTETNFPLTLEPEEQRQNFWGLPPVSNSCLWFTVTESNFSSDRKQQRIRRVTEKTMKALVYGRPFILVAEAQTLNYLHELGFNTYGTVIDERYDLIEQSHIRMEAIMEVIKGTAQKRISKGELMALRKIGQMNREWLLGGFRNHFIAREAKSLSVALERAGLVRG